VSAPPVERTGRRRLFTALDRYVAAEFMRIFAVTLLGFPVLVFVVDLVDNLRKYTERDLTLQTIALSYLYYLPDTMFMVLPAAVLFATVFSIGTFTRYAEITAAKASGISFYRFIVPIVAMSVVAALLCLVVGELAPPANATRTRLLAGEGAQPGNERYNFAFANDLGRVYRVQLLNVREQLMTQVEVEERGSDQRPGLLIASRAAGWDASRGWMLQAGMMHVITDDSSNVAIAFDSLYDRALKETPIELRASDKAPQEMNFGQLSRYIRALERSGTDVAALKVERMLKLAVPVTCVIIALFGAPLATSSQRGGAAFGIGISLATTVLFLVLIQLTKAIGGKGILPPEPTAWLPNVLVGLMALVLLARVRT
jgi:lipopolysaccharide export system permease protein